MKYGIMILGVIMDLVSKIKKIVMIDNQNMIKIDNYNMWENHLKYVVENSLLLAEKYGADKEIVEVSALLHDIALLRFGASVKSDHHNLGSKIADEILTELKVDQNKIGRICSCIRNHRSALNATNVEEICVADADILAHFNNLPMVLKGIYSRNLDKSVEEINDIIESYLMEDYNDLSEETKKFYKKEFKNICKVVLKK